MKKELWINYLATISSGLCALSLGVSAVGFAIGFSRDFIFPFYATTWIRGLVYSLALSIGINTAYRIWKIAEIAVPEGLKLILKGHAAPNALGNRSFLKILGCFLSVCAGTTYGGVAYLGISQFLQLEMVIWKIIFGCIIIGSCFLSSGVLFSYAWIQNINAGTLFGGNALSPSKTYRLLEIISASFALFGLGCLMVVGAFGLAISMVVPSASSLWVASLIAIIGFFGEAPFAIKQGRLLILTFWQRKTIAENSAPIAYTSIVSILLYTSQSFTATFVGIDTVSVPIRLVIAIAASYLSLISCIREPDHWRQQPSACPLTMCEQGY